MTEYQIQCKLFHYLRSHPDHRVRLAYSHLNGMRSSIAEGAKAKRSGALPGIPDIFIPLMSRGFGGLYIELKTEKGRLSAIQNEMLSRLTQAGYMAVVCHGLDEAIAAVEEYLNLQP